MATGNQSIVPTKKCYQELSPSRKSDDLAMPLESRARTTGGRVLCRAHFQVSSTMWYFSKRKVTTARRQCLLSGTHICVAIDDQFRHQGCGSVISRGNRRCFVNS
eukprot:665007-Pleurochrysis_carterae.AAC.1